ncbi:hypothetical protein LTR37_005309, partial [Vermiconidia calcicola]
AGHGRPLLPPMQVPATASSASRSSSNALSIKSLLSNNPESPKGRRQQPAQFHAAIPPQYPTTSRPSVSTSDGRAQMHSRPPALPHYNEGPPMQLRSPAPLTQTQQFQQHPPPVWGHPAASMEPELPHYSPATSTHSFAQSHYSGSSDPSPRNSVAPPSYFPMQQRVTQAPPYDYHISIRQQPVAARACGFGERDRRVIDPPPILELKITDKATGRPEEDYGGLLALHCTLLSHDGTEDETEVPPAHDGMPATRRLMGTLVASPYQAKDESGVAGTFFVFPDLSCRSPGRYRLRFKLLRVDPTNMTPGSISKSVGSIETDIFAVYTAKDFPGMRASSALLKSLRRQGLNVGVKKGSDARKGKGKAKKEASSDEDDDSDDEEKRGSDDSAERSSGADVSPKTKEKKKKGKRKKQEA